MKTLDAKIHAGACTGNLQQPVSSQAPFLLVRPGRRSLEGEEFGKWTRSGMFRATCMRCHHKRYQPLPERKFPDNLCMRSVLDWPPKKII